MRGKGVKPPLEAGLLELAARQHNVVARAQALAVGLSADQIDRRVARGWLRIVQRGVYAVGSTALTRDGVWMAAALALGEGAAISHRSAAELWGLAPGCSAPLHVTTGGGGRRSRAGLAVHRAALGAEVTRKRNVPVTRPARTLIDLAEIADRRTLERAADEAERQRLTTESQLRQAIDRHPGRRGAALLGALLADHALGATATANDFEELLIGICDGHGIPRPVCQATVGPYRPDFVWPTHRLVVEADGRQTHGTRRAFESDRRRDADLATMGWTVLRFTWRQLTGEPGWVARTIHRALGR